VRASDLSLETIALDTVLEQLAGVTRLKLVILDACRNNLFPVAGGKRSVTRGLSRIEPEDNTLVVYAAKDGTTAEDGAGRRHSPFTESLLKHIATPDLEINFVFRRVRDDVVAATSPVQTPHVYGTLGGREVYLRPQAAPSGAGPLAERPLPPLGDAVVFRDCFDCPEMVMVPAGDFLMGSPSGEEGRSDSEGPQRRVTIRRPFAVGKFEVTFAEWRACAAAGGCRTDAFNRAADLLYSRFPVEVMWRDANEYASWLSRKTGKPYRLLSEAEWEYVARAGTTTRYPFGDTITTGQAKHDGKHAREVGSFPANRFGLHDMHGNALEWVQDCWNATYSGAPTDGSAWIAGDCSVRVLRGGSYSHGPNDIRSASRYRRGDHWLRDEAGFRLARSLTP
jgi:formylglycine-generating enzyme required for sulfatase activity